MIQIEDVVVSSDILTEKFCCNLEACGGACCIEGDAGAPVEEEEVAELEKVVPVVWDSLTEAAKETIRRQGVVYRDRDGDLVTSIVGDKDCVFTCYGADGMCCCAIEKAYREGKVDFYKPISCLKFIIVNLKCQGKARRRRTSEKQVLRYRRKTGAYALAANSRPLFLAQRRERRLRR